MKPFVYLLGIVGIGLCSCESDTYANYEIQNNCDYNINYSYVDISYDYITYDNIYDTITQTLYAGTKQNIGYFSKRGKQLTVINPTEVIGDYFIITNDKGDTCKLDVKELSSWFITMSNSKSVAEHNYVLEIDSTDFGK